VYNFCGISAQGYIYINHFGLKKKPPGMEDQGKTGTENRERDDSIFQDLRLGGT